MKRIIKLLSITMVVALLLTSFPVSAIANDGFTYDSSTKVLEIFNDSAVVDYTETSSVNTPWYNYKDEVVSVIIHNGVTRIGSYNFAKMSNLENIEIPNSVTYIGTAAFAANSKLTQISISDNVVEIGDNAFGFNDEMKITDGFMCLCSAGSVAQEYCFKNYIPFSTPIPDSKTDIVIDTNGTSTDYKMTMWSITPDRDMQLIFYSSGNFDTYGYLFDADNYVYSSEYSITNKSAIVTNDDGGADLNFRIKYKLEANKNYYLAAKFSLPSKTGKFTVNFDLSCSNDHSYTLGNKVYDATTSSPAKYNQICSYCGKASSELVEVGEKLPMFNLTYTDPVTGQEVMFDTKADTDASPFQTIPNVTDNIFLGWYDGDSAYDTSSKPTSTANINAKYQGISTIQKDENDDKSIEEYKSFGIAGVQIREAGIVDKYTQAELPEGIRFVAAFSEELYNQLNVTQVLDYGFAVATKSNADNNATSNDYKIAVGDRGVRAASCMTGKDHRNFDDYRLFTLVVECDNTAEKSIEIVARAYVVYKDANGTTRVYYDNYDGTNVYGGCSTSYNAVNAIRM